MPDISQPDISHDDNMSRGGPALDQTPPLEDSSSGSSGPPPPPPQEDPTVGNGAAAADGMPTDAVAPATAAARQVIMLDHSDSTDKDSTSDPDQHASGDSADKRTADARALKHLTSENAQLRNALQQAQAETKAAKAELAAEVHRLVTAQQQLELALRASKEQVKQLRAQCEVAERRAQACRGEVVFVQEELRRLQETHNQSVGRASEEIQALKGQLQHTVPVEKDQVRTLEAAASTAHDRMTAYHQHNSTAAEADLLELSTDPLSKATLVLDQMSRLPDLFHSQLRAIEERESRKISLQGFRVGELAVFFPIPRMHNHFIAFNVGCPNHFLADESKAIIGHAKHFTKDYVLGTIVEKEEHVSDGSSYIAADATYFTLKVMAISAVFDT